MPQTPPGKMPHSLEAERSVLGAILLSPPVLDEIGELCQGDFHHPPHQQIFAVMRSLDLSGTPCDAVIVAESLKARDQLAGVGGAEYLQRLMESTPHVGHAAYYAGIVREKARRREVIRAAERVARRAADDSLPVGELLADSEGLPADFARPEARPAPVVRKLADVQPERLDWLWQERIPMGKLTLIAGDPSAGKSTLTIDMAARVSRGAAWPDAPVIAQPVGSVVLFSAEDDLADTVRPRLDAAGADVSRIVAVQGVRYPGQREGAARHFSLETDLPHLEQVLRETPGVRLVVIDPISAYCGKADTHNNSEVRGLLAPLADLAARHRVAVVAVTHMNKGPGGKALYRAMGSLAFIAAARAGWLVARDPHDRERRLLLPVKTNLCASPTGLAYAIVNGAVAWEADPVGMAGDDLLEAELERTQGSGRRTERQEAVDWLRDVLENCSPLAVEAKRQARESGITKATLRRAYDALRVTAKHVGFGPGSRWYWTLNPIPTPDADDAAGPTGGVFDDGWEWPEDDSDRRSWVACAFIGAHRHHRCSPLGCEQLWPE